jgi:hypothetical protein
VKNPLALSLSLLLAACGTPQKSVPDLRLDFVGAYQAEHAVDTVENLALQADGRFVYDYLAIFGQSARYEGRWEVRDSLIVLIATDTVGKEVEFPLQIFRRSSDLALIFSQESYQTRAKMLLPDSYRRISKTPNKALEPTPGSVTPRADARVAPAPVVAHL